MRSMDSFVFKDKLILISLQEEYEILNDTKVLNTFEREKITFKGDMKLFCKREKLGS